MGIKDWRKTAAENTSVSTFDSTINWAEGQAPSTVNDSARAMMADVATQYEPSVWGWVAISATVSTSSTNIIKVAGNLTTDFVANRALKLVSGASTIYASVISSSYTSETTVTLNDLNGSLCASHSVVWLSAVEPNALPANVVTGEDSTFQNSVSFSASVHFAGLISVGGEANFAGETNFTESVSFSASVQMLGFVNMTGGAAVSSATLSIASGMLTVGGTSIAGGGWIAHGDNPAQPTTGSLELDFGSIPAGTSHIKIDFSGMKAQTGTPQIRIRIGDSGGVETTGYDSKAGGSSTTNTSVESFILGGNYDVTFLALGEMVLTHIGSNTWVANGHSIAERLGSRGVWSAVGSKTLSGELTTVRFVASTSFTAAGAIALFYQL